MTNSLYDKGRESFLKGEISFNVDNIKGVLVDTALYVVDLVNHQFLSDIPVGARVATSPNLGTKTTAAGVADAADLTFPLVTGATVEALAIYQDTGVAATSRLIGYIDVATGLPATPSGGDITVVWDSGVNRIFKL